MEYKHNRNGCSIYEINSVPPETCIGSAPCEIWVFSCTTFHSY